MELISLILFCLGLLVAFVAEHRWRTAGLIHRLLHLALEAGAPIEADHDHITDRWFWLRNITCAANIVAASTFLAGNSYIDGWVIVAKVIICMSLGMSFVRVWLNTRCDRRPTRKKLRVRVKEWVKAHRPHLVPARRPAPSPV